MSTAPKKLLILAILEVLRKYTNIDHRLLQSEIIAKLESDYDLTATRKSVRANLADLEDAGYPVLYDNGWYYDHEFCDAELNLLVDSLMYNPNVPYHQCRELIGKLRTLGGNCYHPAYGTSQKRPSNPQFLYTMDVLHEAISTEKKVSFHYGDYDVDKQLHPRLNDSGEPKEYLINPYRIVFANGRYYLICNVDKYDNLTHFRMDYIMDVRIEDSPVKQIRNMEDFRNGVDTAKYIAEHPHMFSGKVDTARIIVRRDFVSELLDWFGLDVEFTRVTDTEVEALIRTDELSLYYWLNMYKDYAWRL